MGEGETESRPYEHKQTICCGELTGRLKKYDDSRQQYPQPEIVIVMKAGGNSCVLIRRLYLPAVTAVTLNKNSNAGAMA